MVKREGFAVNPRKSSIGLEPGLSNDIVLRPIWVPTTSATTAPKL